MNIKFQLRNPKAPTSSIIMMRINRNNLRYKISTGISINPAYWNNRNQRPRETMDFLDGAAIGNSLDGLVIKAKEVFQYAEKEGIVLTGEQFRSFMQKSSVEDQSVTLTFWEAYDRFLDYKRPRVVRDVMKDYENSLPKHLRAVEKKMGIPLSFNALKNQAGGFVEQLDNYLTYEAANSKDTPGLSTNTVGKQFKNLKCFLNWCFECDICPRFGTRHMETKKEDVQKVYLNREELLRLTELPLTDETERTVRDLFLVGCETGLRFSDYSRLGRQHIHEKRIVIIQTKTNERVMIPISKRLRIILDQYNNELPQFENLTLFNKIIRKLCQQADISEPVTFTRKKGRHKTEFSHPKYELVSSHTCRRSFCTNLFREDNIPAQIIMPVSGHKTERAFMRYLNIDGEYAAMTLERMMG